MITQIGKLGQGITIKNGKVCVADLVQRSIPGVVNVDDVLMYWPAPYDGYIDKVSATLLVGPTGTSTAFRLQVMKNGVLETDSIFESDQAITITDTTTPVNGVYTATSNLDPNRISFVAGDVIHFRVNQADIGSFGLLAYLWVYYT
jgi:hypothetical protein